MYLLILFIPLFSATAAGLFGRHLGEKGAGVLTTACIALTSALS
jgi:NADH:ubiquinone oxidoreductase subunit 5 (subunit L)/multisubunit Na+/H+ antiporter MnhA subunit